MFFTHFHHFGQFGTVPKTAPVQSLWKIAIIKSSLWFSNILEYLQLLLDILSTKIIIYYILCRYYIVKKIVKKLLHEFFLYI